MHRSLSRCSRIPQCGCSLKIFACEACVVSRGYSATPNPAKVGSEARSSLTARVMVGVSPPLIVWRACWSLRLREKSQFLRHPCNASCAPCLRTAGIKIRHQSKSLGCQELESFPPSKPTLQNFPTLVKIPCPSLKNSAIPLP